MMNRTTTNVEKVGKEKKVAKSQFAVLKSEKITFTKSLEEAKVACDEAITMIASLKSEQERLIRVAKAEAEEKLAQALSENKQVIKTLDEEKIDRKVAEEVIRSKAFDRAKKEAVGNIIKFGMGFRHFALFIIKKKYPNLDQSNVDLTLIEGHDKLDPTDGSVPQEG